MALNEQQAPTTAAVLVLRTRGPRLRPRAPDGHSCPSSSGLQPPRDPRRGGAWERPRGRPSGPVRRPPCRSRMPPRHEQARGLAPRSAAPRSPGPRGAGTAWLPHGRRASGDRGLQVPQGPGSTVVSGTQHAAPTWASWSAIVSASPCLGIGASTVTCGSENLDRPVEAPCGPAVGLQLQAAPVGTATFKGHSPPWPSRPSAGPRERGAAPGVRASSVSVRRTGGRPRRGATGTVAGASPRRLGMPRVADAGRTPLPGRPRGWSPCFLKPPERRSPSLPAPSMSDRHSPSSPATESARWSPSRGPRSPSGGARATRSRSRIVGLGQARRAHPRRPRSRGPGPRQHQWHAGRRRACRGAAGPGRRRAAVRQRGAALRGRLRGPPRWRGGRICERGG